MVVFNESKLRSNGDWRGIRKLLSITLILTAVISALPQNNIYWNNAIAGSTRIYTINFVDEQKGEAVSAEGHKFLTNDGGLSWTLDSVSTKLPNNSTEKHWRADVFCAVMHSTDGGTTWIPYDKEKQDHFCGVYLEDPNTGHSIASSFLYKVTSKVFLCLKNNEIKSLLDQPQQCTEYFRSPTEGWALGWCIKNFNQFEN